MSLRLALCLALATVAAGGAQSAGPEGILLLAHGGQTAWNGRVSAMAAEINASQPVEVAFGMASRPAIQSAVDRLVARGVASIVAVPLFVSSHSSVVTSTEYLLGLRREMPPDLKIFAKMRHNHGGTSTEDAHAGHQAPTVDGTTPVHSKVPIRMTPALNSHQLVGAVLLDRARSISTAPESEAVVIVAHGPVPDDDNARWLADMRTLAEQIESDGDFAAISYLTVRDDAPKPVRDAATAELRTVVTTHIGAGRRVLVVPLLLSFGGIEKGIRERLDGLQYTMPDSALMPDPRIAAWVLESAKRR
jgi:sirohydrochlorin ferrochelatase